MDNKQYFEINWIYIIRKSEGGGQDLFENDMEIYIIFLYRYLKIKI